jgi:hypothetical protein
MHWSSKYLGLKYQPGARGPENVDCWGLVRLVYLQEFRIELPLFPGVAESVAFKLRSFIEEETNRNWIQSEPFEGAGVAMSRGRAVCHVGIWTPLDGGKVIHCLEGVNVVADTIRNLKLKGLRYLEFYRHKSWPT